MQDHLETFEQFRQALYRIFPYRRDSLLDLLDALCSNDRADSPVELCLNPLFRRQYSAVYRAIDEAYLESQYPVCSIEAYRQGAAILSRIPAPQQLGYRVFGIDETPNERLFSPCLADRQTVHRSTPVNGQRPISIGHNYSILAAMPEPTPTDWPRWAVPVSVERVSSLSNAIEVAHSQISQLMSYPDMEQSSLNVLSVDSRYPSPTFLHGLSTYDNLVVVARLRSNRVLYQQPDGQQNKTRPRWYGERFCLHEPSTWPPPIDQQQLRLTGAKGQTSTMHLRRWSDLLMRGTRNAPMHQHPFDVVQIQRLDEVGEPYGKPMWLLVDGKQRQALSTIELYQAYRQRFNLEHFFGFAKAHLLLSASQSCEVAHEINWVRLTCLAQVQLWLSRGLVDGLPLPWQRYSKPAQTCQLTPRTIQRGFAQLIGQIGTIASESKPRGISPGRKNGTRLVPRASCPVVKFRPSQKWCRCQETQEAA